MSEDHPYEKCEPHYDLAEVRRAFEGDRFKPSQRVARHLRSHGWALEMIRVVVCDLEARDFHKSQVHRARAAAGLDIYRPTWRGQRLYVKFTQLECGERFFVLSFCPDGEAH